MKYIKLYENNYEESDINNYHLNKEKSKKISNKISKELYKFFINFDEFLITDKILNYRKNIEDGYIVDIFLNDDDYYFLSTRNYTDPRINYKYYKCDQFNGLVSLLKSGKILYL